MKRKNSIHYNLKLTIAFLSFLFVLIAAKLVFVAVSNDVDGIDLRAFADNRNTSTKTLYASRGTIYDRNNNILAVDTNSYTVIGYLNSSRTTNEASPQHVLDKETTARVLAPVLEREESVLLELLNRENLYQVELKRGITEAKKNEIIALDLPGIDFIQSTKRYYPYGNYASYLLGYAKADDEGEIQGEMGIEQYFNDTLKGENGSITYERDLYGYRIPSVPYTQVDSKSGANLYLTLDQDIQLVLKNAIHDLTSNYTFDWATITVMDAKSGAILGSSNNPSFDLNTREDLDSYLNPLVSYTYEPGSVMKIFSFMDAIEKGMYNGDEVFHSGSIELSDGTKIKDFNNTGWGDITFDTGFAYSSNVAATNLALRLGAKELRSFYEKLGFGKTTGIELPGELDGKIAFQYESELATASFGQGITVTPIQMLQALSVLCNDGVMVKPYLVSKIVDDTGKVIEEFGREEVGAVASKETTQKVRDLMYKMIYDGFSSSKAFAPSNVTLIGKTGTAQIASPKGGYLTGEYDYIKSFAGVFPYDNPQYVVYIAIKKFVGGTNDIARIINAVVEETAKAMHIVEMASDVDESKIVVLSHMISKQTEVMVEELTKKGLVPIVLGNGKYIVGQYPLEKQKVLQGSKVFLATNSLEVTMPDVVGYSTNEIVTLCNLIGVPYHLNGYGKVVSTSIPTGGVIDKTSILEIYLEK